jgi:hypothetical protein
LLPFIRLSCEAFAKKNTLSYLTGASVMKKIKFIKAGTSRMKGPMMWKKRFIQRM